MVERLAVNEDVRGSSPLGGARLVDEFENLPINPLYRAFLLDLKFDSHLLYFSYFRTNSHNHCLG